MEGVRSMTEGPSSACTSLPGASRSAASGRSASSSSGMVKRTARRPQTPFRGARRAPRFASTTTAGCWGPAASTYDRLWLLMSLDGFKN